MMLIPVPLAATVSLGWLTWTSTPQQYAAAVPLGTTRHCLRSSAQYAWQAESTMTQILPLSAYRVRVDSTATLLVVSARATSVYKGDSHPPEAMWQRRLVRLAPVGSILRMGLPAALLVHQALLTQMKAQSRHALHAPTVLMQAVVVCHVNGVCPAKLTQIWIHPRLVRNVREGQSGSRLMMALPRVESQA